MIRSAPVASMFWFIETGRKTRVSPIPGVRLGSWRGHYFPVATESVLLSRHRRNWGLVLGSVVRAYWRDALGRFRAIARMGRLCDMDGRVLALLCIYFDMLLVRIVPGDGPTGPPITSTPKENSKPRGERGFTQS